MSHQRWHRAEAILQQQLSGTQISYQPCTTITIVVLQGRGISVGLCHDFFDTPDAQVYLRCSSALGPKSFKTQVSRNTRNPKWDESFTFVLSKDTDDAEILIDVYEEDKFKCDPHLAVGIFQQRDLEFDRSTFKTIDMGKHGKIDIELLKERRTSPDCRLSLGLSEPEKEYRLKRKPKTMTALQKALENEGGPTTLEETPTIALAISGGGYRAVISSCGVMEALAEAGLSDALMYITGMSGSSWYISSSFYHKTLDKFENLVQYHDWLRKRMEKSLTRCLFDISFHRRYSEYSDFKQEHNQYTTFVDFYGLALGEEFLGEWSTKATLSSLRDYVQEANVPFPIMNCAHVEEYLPLSQYWDEVEITPYEVSLPSYGINIPTENFNSRWCNGILQQKLPEPPLHYIMGASGSAFAILLRDISRANEINEDLQAYIDKFQGSHHVERKDGKTDEDSDGEEQVPESPPEHLRDEGLKNFASADDRWIEILKMKASGKQIPAEPEDEAITGRGFLLERTAKVWNCANQLIEPQRYLFNTQPVDSQHSNANNRFCRKISSKKRKIHLCDSALGCNLPTIHVVRPHRAVDVLIVVDASMYYGENDLSKELFATVQNQMQDHGIKFPRISIDKIAEDPFRELYLFEDPADPECPIVLWFTLANGKFKELETPPRRTGHQIPSDDGASEKKFNDFNIFAESSEFATLRLSFSPLNFDRLRELMKFNVTSNLHIIKEKIALKVQQLRSRYQTNE